MASLIESDIWRDGGSISAVVLDGVLRRAFWLQTNRWDHPRNVGHDNLFVSEGDRPELKQKQVEIASADERQWLDYLTQVDDNEAKDESKQLFQAMLRVLRARQKYKP